MFVIYATNDEVIVTTKKKEQKMLEEYFGDNTNRSVEEYNRCERESWTGIPVRVGLGY
jgi:hypothetical protein